MTMKRINCILLLMLTSVIVNPAFGQETKDSVEITVRPYVSLRGHAAIYDGEMELQENASRIGTEISIKHKKVAFLAGGEVQVSMFRGSSSFSADGSLSGGFLTVQAPQTKQVFGNRLGYLGVDLNKFGTLTIGKQWSVYRDITSYTDRLNVFGAKASATFIGGTDGGENGTGRADQSIIYRNRIGFFRFGAQIQARGGSNKKFIDGFGLSAQFEITKDLLIGTAFNSAFLSKNLINSGKIAGLTGQPVYLSVGSKFTGKKLELGIVGVIQENGDFTQGHYIDPQEGLLHPTIVFDARGIEVFGKYKFKKLSILAGYNHYAPIKSRIPDIAGQLPVDKAFGRNDFIIGLSYQPLKYVFIYTEQRISTGKSAMGEREKSVFTLGIKIELSKSFKKKIAL